MLTPESDPVPWQLFRNCSVLSTLSSLALQELFAAAEERSFKAGDVMVRQGDPAEGLLILLQGAAHASLRGADGVEHCLGRFTGGDLVGEMALVTREARSASVIADESSRTLLVRTASFDALAMRHLELGMVLTQLVADRLGQGAHDGFGGKMVEGFRIVQCVGRGAMAVVYRARHESTGELVALKMMSYRLIYDAPALARFHQEAALVQAFDHENIARLMRLFPAYHTYFLVMELCEGVDLHRLVRARGPLPESRVRPILGQLASALEYVHRRGVVHRDLKPANVMITNDGQVKLTDFGIAAPALGLNEQTGTADQSLMGTPAFMAPEQLAGRGVDARTDLYALGCLAYEMLTGRQLFRASNIFDLVQEKLMMQLPPAAEIGQGISRELYDFLQSALRVNPDERPTSAAPLVSWAARCDMAPDL